MIIIDRLWDEMGATYMRFPEVTTTPTTTTPNTNNNNNNNNNNDRS
jgi:hypothetical protein